VIGLILTNGLEWLWKNAVSAEGQLFFLFLSSAFEENRDASRST